MIVPGDKIDMITVLEHVGSSDNGDRLLKCKCDCGNIVIRRASTLSNKRGYRVSCGCIRKTTLIQIMKSKETRFKMSKSAQAHKDQTVERFKKLHDIEDGTSYRAVAKENSRKDNKLGIKNIYQDKNNGLYILQMQMGTFKIRKSFSSLDEAIEERDRIRKEVILPAVEAHKTLSD